MQAKRTECRPFIRNDNGLEEDFALRSACPEPFALLYSEHPIFEVVNHTLSPVQFIQTGPGPDVTYVHLNGLLKFRSGQFILSLADIA